MKKIVIIFGCLILITMSLYTTAFAASVTPQLITGNDSNPKDYTLPADSIHYEIPDSNAEGSHTVIFDDSGAVNPNGSNSFTVVIGKENGQNYSKVLSWTSNFPLYAVILKGGDAFHVYQYSDTVRSDTDLASPNTALQQPADLSHVSIVYNPDNLQPSLPGIMYLAASAGFIVVFFLLGLIFGMILNSRKGNREKKKKIKNMEDKNTPLEMALPVSDTPASPSENHHSPKKRRSHHHHHKH